MSYSSSALIFESESDLISLAIDTKLSGGLNARDLIGVVSGAAHWRTLR